MALRRSLAGLCCRSGLKDDLPAAVHALPICAEHAKTTKIMQFSPRYHACMHVACERLHVLVTGKGCRVSISQIRTLQLLHVVEQFSPTKCMIRCMAGPG